MTRSNQSAGNDANDGQTLLDRAKAMTASPLLYVGAITVVGSLEAVEILVETYAIPELYGTILLFPITLALLYLQLIALAYYERSGYRRGCAETA
jgi:hypothetical protein